MISVKLKDGRGSKNYAKINGEGELQVVVHPHPPLGEELTGIPFRQYFTDTGDSSGSNDMRVNGSTTAQKFYIGGSTDYDIYIKYLSIQISDNGARLVRFGKLTALTNGVKFEYFSQSIGNYEIHEGIKDNLTFLRIGDGYATGDGSTAFRADIAGGGGKDTYFFTIDFTKQFALQYGLRLEKNTTDRLQFVIQDDLSAGLDDFNIIGTGMRI